eukprot:7226767-Prymnesium_polylepis.1
MCLRGRVRACVDPSRKRGQSAHRGCGEDGRCCPRKKGRRRRRTALGCASLTGDLGRCAVRVRNIVGEKER